MTEYERTGESDVVPSARVRLFHVACILIIPFVQLAINRNLFINPVGQWIDQWVYTGCFVGFSTRLHLFAGTYYVTRLSWILPGILLHSVLPPLVANYVLHLGFFYALLFATYELVRISVSRSTAILVTIVMGWSPIIVASLSWDYVDGAGIVFLVGTLLCLEKVVQSERYRGLWGTAAGALMACMAASNLILIVMPPIAFLFLIVRVGIGRWRLVVATVIPVAGGALVMFAALGLANWMFGGSWLFLAPSFTAALSIAANAEVYPYAWYHRASWLVLPATAALGAILDLLFWPRSCPPFARAINVTLLAVIAVWIGLDLRRVPVLELTHYVSYLAPLSLLTLSIQAARIGASSERERFRPAIAAMVLFAGAHWLFLTQGPLLMRTLIQYPAVRRAYDLVWFGPFSGDSLSTLLAVTGGLIALISLRVVPAGPAKWYGFVLGIMLGCAAMPVHWPPAIARDVQASFVQIVQVDRYIERNIGEHSLRFWYDLNAIPQQWFRSLSSTYFWGYTLVNERLPELSAAEASGLTVSSRFVFLVRTLQDVDRARQSLRAYGFDVSLVDRRDFGEGDRSVSVVLADLIRLPAATQDR